jgi:hypothetical protein
MARSTPQKITPRPSVKAVTHYHEFACIRSHAELFEAFITRYQVLAENNDLEWIVEDLRPFPTAAAQRDYLAEQGYLDE